MSISIDASSDIFRFYNKGVIKEDDGCGNGINHGVVIVGYSDPEPLPEPECHINRWWISCPDPPARRDLQDASGHSNYWKLMNSWGTGWGDHGYLRVQITDGVGVCGMNRWVQYAEWENYTDPNP